MQNGDIALGHDFAAELSLRRYTPQGAARWKIAERSGAAPPLPAKRYPGAPRVQLPPVAGLALGDALPLLAGPEPGAPAEVEPLLRLAALLGFGAGVSRLEVLHEWPLHRVFASARCLYPTEVYVALSGDAAGPEVSPGLYSYQALDHALARVVEGDAAAAVLRGCPGHRTPDPSLVLLVSSVFGRTSYKYGDFAYRLCSHEAGMVVVNLMAAARALGYDASVRFDFVDQELESLVGMPAGGEGVWAVLTLADRGERPRPAPRPEHAVPPPAQADPRSYLDPVWHAGVARFHGASSLSRHEVPAAAYALPTTPHDGAWTHLPETVPPPRSAAATVWKRRRSGSSVFLSSRSRPMPLDVLAAMLRAAGAPSPRDGGAGEPLEVALYCAVNAVEGLARGVYRYDAAHDALATVREGDVRMALQGAYHEKNVNLFAVPCAFFMVGDYPGCFQRHGNRGYRVLNLHTGMMAQRLTLAAGAYDYSVRCLDGVNEHAAGALLGLAPPEQALHLVACFEDRGGDRFSATLLP